MKDYTELEQRALSAYFRQASRKFPGMGSTMQPSDVVETTHEGLRYVVLENRYRRLAVYRVRTVNGKDVLKGLKRWPADLRW